MSDRYIQIISLFKSIIMSIWTLFKTSQSFAKMKIFIKIEKNFINYYLMKLIKSETS